ncbi:hypothetical protein AMECASPLE_038403 [Ameca splendens]|uniref:Uncharacterized protein n=1 Tax=Ameca splendens TaxID=208324 RepID=A0ABV0ZGX4_9TELE
MKSCCSMRCSHVIMEEKKTDHPKAAALLQSQPYQLWAEGPTDVGLTPCAPVSFQVASPSSIWVPQYPHKQQAQDGIRDTIEGLKAAGMLEHLSLIMEYTQPSCREKRYTFPNVNVCQVSRNTLLSGHLPYINIAESVRQMAH